MVTTTRVNKVGRYTATTFASFSDALTTIGYAAISLTSDHILVRDQSDSIEKEISFGHIVQAGWRSGSVATTVDGGNLITTAAIAGNNITISKITIDDLFAEHTPVTVAAHLTLDNVTDFMRDTLPDATDIAVGDYILYYDLSADTVRRETLSNTLALGGGGLTNSAMTSFVTNLASMASNQVSTASDSIMIEDSSASEVKRIVPGTLLTAMWRYEPADTSPLATDEVLTRRGLTTIQRVLVSDLLDLGTGTFTLTESAMAGILSSTGSPDTYDVSTHHIPIIRNATTLQQTTPDNMFLKVFEAATDDATPDDSDRLLLVNGTYTSLKSSPFSAFGGSGGASITNSAMVTFFDSLSFLASNSVASTSDTIMVMDASADEVKDISVAILLTAMWRHEPAEDTPLLTDEVLTRRGSTTVQRVEISDLLALGTGTGTSLTNDAMDDFIDGLGSMSSSEVSPTGDRLMIQDASADEVKRISPGLLLTAMWRHESTETSPLDTDEVLTRRGTTTIQRVAISDLLSLATGGTYTATTFATFADSLTTLGHGAVNLTADHLLIRDGTTEKEISFSNMVFAGHRVGTVETTATGSNRIATINTAGNIIRRISISDLFTQHGGGTGTTFTLNNDDMADYFSDVLPSFGSQTPSQG